MPMAGSCARAPEPLPAIARGSTTALRSVVDPLCRTQALDRTESAKHGKVLPMSPDVFVTYLPSRSGEPTASRARGTRAIALWSRTRKTSCTDDSICPRGTSMPLRLKRQSRPKGHKEWHEPGQQVREDTRLSQWQLRMQRTPRLETRTARGPTRDHRHL